ncbi:MAG: AI-2E family transporter [Clostridiales bacterium]|jgi:predicted PurR-regulated permease PerM|nr:AI-2E family transporter [Clostridiales bacterium]
MWYTDSKLNKKGMNVCVRVNMNRNKIFTYLVITLTSISFYFAMQNFDMIADYIGKVLGILKPFLVGIAIAYLLWRPLKFIESVLEKFIFRGKVSKGNRRIVGVVVLYLIAAVVIVSLFSFVLPQIIESLTALTNNLPGYFESIKQSLDTLLRNSGMDGDIYQFVSDLIGDLSQMMMQITAKVLPMLIDLSVGVTSTILNTFLAIVVSIYCLVDKETFFAKNRKCMHALLSQRLIGQITRVVTIFDDTFGRYFVGQLTDAVIVGSICFVMMLTFKFPFALLISVIVMCTNVIPYVGPFIGAVPGTFIILMTGGFGPACGFVLMIFVLQQIDGNILVPKIIGDSIGISGFWVLFAVMVGGGLFGFIGVLLGVPSLSVLFKLIKAYSEKKLRQKELPVDTEAYE